LQKNILSINLVDLPFTPKTSIQSQLDVFAKQLSEQTGLPRIQADDWSTMFLLLADKIKTGRIIVLFDEISWMGSKDADFLGKLKNAWDMHFKKILSSSSFSVVRYHHGSIKIFY
jgi:hypothetical protein